MITTVSAVPGIKNLSLLPDFAFGGTSSSYVSSSVSSSSSSSARTTSSLFPGIENEMMRPGSAPSGTMITTVSAVPGIKNLSLLPGFAFGGTSSSYASPSSASALFTFGLALARAEAALCGVLERTAALAARASASACTLAAISCIGGLLVGLPSPLGSRSSGTSIGFGCLGFGMGASSETSEALARVAAASLSSWSFDDSTGVPFPLSTVFHFLLPNENLFLVSAHLGEWPALGVSGKCGCGVVAPVGSHFDRDDGGIASGLSD